MKPTFTDVLVIVAIALISYALPVRFENANDLLLNESRSPGRLGSALVGEPSELVSSKETPGEPDSISSKQHFEDFRKALPVEVRDKLLSFDELSTGPRELVDLLSEDKKIQKNAFDALWTNGGYEDTYDKHGENILPYLGYVLLEFENRNSKTALKFLFEVSWILSLKSRRGPYEAIDDDAIEEYLSKVPNNVPELSSYAPLKCILLRKLSEGLTRGNRSDAGWILVQAYDADQEIEEALGRQFSDKQSGNIDMEIMAAMGHMGMTAKYEHGFLSPLTMDLMIEALDDDNSSNLHYATHFIGKYKPQSALPKLLLNVSSQDNIRSYAVLNAIGSYGPSASEYIPQLQTILDKEEDESRKAEFRKVIAQISPVIVN
ncbi:MAG: hypothetical protein ACI9CB_001057 [Rhodothermales bacterium]|jgi:hypothetical protein